jgi:hypothetical protein
MAIGMSMTYTIIISLIAIPAAYGMFTFYGKAHLTISGNSIFYYIFNDTTTIILTF